MLTVLLVDDQHLVRSGFGVMISVEDDLEVVGEAADGAAALTLARELRPDVVLMDVQMPVLDGIEATARIVAEDLAKVIILTTFDRDDYLFDGLRAGASGFLLKNCDSDHLIEAIRSVGHGHALLAPQVTRRVIASMVASPVGTAPSGRPAGDPGADPGHAQALTRLTEREREVLTHIARGHSNAEIARELYLGEATVKTHVSNCLSKLHLRDRVQAVVFAYEAGLVRPGA